MTTPPRRIIRRAVDPAPAAATPPPRRAIARQPLPAPAVKTAPASDHKQCILHAFTALDEVDSQLALLIQRKTELEADITKHMEDGKLKSVTDGRYEATETEVRSKGHRDINAKEFFDLVADRGPREEAMAWEAMSVTATAAGALLTPVELNKHFPMTPGKVTGHKVVIHRVEVKSGKKGK